MSAPATPPPAPWRAEIVTLFPEAFPGTLGLSLTGRMPKFVKNFMAEQNDIPGAIGAYVKAVKDVSFPAAEHGFSA